MQNSYALGQKVTKPKYWLFNLVLLASVTLFAIGSLYSSLPLQPALADQNPNLRAQSYQRVNPLTKISNQYQDFTTDQLVEILPDGSSFMVQSNQTSLHNQKSKIFKSASLYKLFVAHAVLEQVDAGKRSLDTPMIEGHTLASCLEIMINVSDNPCGVAMQSWANTAEFNRTLSERGYICSDMSGYFPTTCASDVVKLLQDIDNAKYLSQDSADLMLKHMANQKITDRIPAQLGDYQVLNKTADLSDVSHDAAIIRLDSGDSIYMVVMTDSSQNRANTYAQIADFAKTAIESL